jgi:hypothetical protein
MGFTCVPVVTNWVDKDGKTLLDIIGRMYPG